MGPGSQPVCRPCERASSASVFLIVSAPTGQIMESHFLVEKELNRVSFYPSYLILVQIHLGQVMRSCERGDPGLIVVVNFF